MPNMEKHRRFSELILRKFLVCVCSLFVASFFWLYMGTVRMNTITMEVVPISHNEIDTGVISPNPTANTSSILWDKLRTPTTKDSRNGTKDPHGQPFNEFVRHLKHEKEELVKTRVKRFAHWHSGLARLQKKGLGKATSIPAVVGGNDNSGDIPLGTHEDNELGDGEETGYIRISSEEDSRLKNDENLATGDHLKFKARVIETKLTIVPTTFHSSPGAGDINLGTTKTSFITPPPQKPETLVEESTKRPEVVFGSSAEGKDDSIANSGESGDDGNDESDDEEQDENSEYDDDEDNDESSENSESDEEEEDDESES